MKLSIPLYGIHGIIRVEGTYKVTILSIPLYGIAGTQRNIWIIETYVPFLFPYMGLRYLESLRSQ